MRITDLIEQLQDILNTHGNLRIGCSAASPGAGDGYPVTEVYLVEGGDNMTYVDINVNTNDEPLNE